MPTHRNSLGNSKALLSGDRRRLVMHRQREASRTASGRAASSALAHVFEDAIGGGQAVTEADTAASQERHVTGARLAGGRLSAQVIHTRPGV